MGCGCGGGVGPDATGSMRLAPTKRPGYTWNGPEEDEEQEADVSEDDEA